MGYLNQLWVWLQARSCPRCRVRSTIFQTNFGVMCMRCYWQCDAASEWIREGRAMISAYRTAKGR